MQGQVGAGYSFHLYSTPFCNSLGIQTEGLGPIAVSILRH